MIVNFLHQLVLKFAAIVGQLIHPNYFQSIIHFSPIRVNLGVLIRKGGNPMNKKISLNFNLNRDGRWWHAGVPQNREGV